MNRNLDLFRNILLELERQKIGEPLLTSTYEGAGFAGHSHAAFVEHVKLLLDAGYIEAKDAGTSMEGDDFLIQRITNAGHDYLDSVRDETVWAKTKEHLKKVGGGAALDTVKAVAKAASLSLLGL